MIEKWLSRELIIINVIMILGILKRIWFFFDNMYCMVLFFIISLIL